MALFRKHPIIIVVFVFGDILAKFLHSLKGFCISLIEKKPERRTKLIFLKRYPTITKSKKKSKLKQQKALAFFSYAKCIKEHNSLSIDRNIHVEMFCRSWNKMTNVSKEKVSALTKKWKFFWDRARGRQWVGLETSLEVSCTPVVDFLFDFES